MIPGGSDFIQERTLEPESRQLESRGLLGPIDRIGAVGYDTGPPTCGDALQLNGAGYLTLPHVSALDVVRVVDFWFFVDAYPGEGEPSWGLFSRDALGTENPGHVTVYFAASGRIAVRLQNDGESLRCTSGALLENAWHHVMVAVDGPELELIVDGTVEDGLNPVDVILDTTYSLDGGASEATPDFSGNGNPRTFGANTAASDEGGTVGAMGFFHGRIDNVRFSTARPEIPSLE